MDTEIVRITRRRLGYNQRHIASISDFEVELPENLVWKINGSRRNIFDKATVVAWVDGSEPLYVGGVPHKVAAFVARAGEWITVKAEFPKDGIKIASTGWLKTASDGLIEDNLLSLDEC